MHTVVDAKSIGFLTGLLAERVRRELNVAFAKEFALWGDGRPLSVDAQSLNDDGFPSAGRFSRMLRHSGPHVITVDADCRMLAVPISQNGAVAAVAVATFAETESPRQLIQTAQLVLDNIQAHDEIERLRQQNEEHLVQATQDLEELTFLRSMAAHLEVTDAGNDMWSLARKILPSLQHSIRAENVLFVAARLTGESHATPSQPLIQVGDNPLPESTCFQLIERFQPQANVKTLVRNRLRLTDSVAGRSIRNLILAPLTKSGCTLAWLMAVNRKDAGEPVGHTRWALSQHEFGTNEASLVESAAAILATHAVNVQLVRDKEKLVANVVRTLVTTIEAKDNYTRGHSERVALFAQCLGRELGLSVDACDELYLTGLVHDVGKIGVCDAILKKVTTLTDAEFEEIKKHPDEGWAILRDLEQLTYVLPGVLHHHERYDGGGYPDGLAGEDIPIEGRIIAVADAYDAMTSDRAYRKVRTQAEAEEVLRSGSGTQWDPQVVSAFFNVKEQIAQLRRNYRARPKPQRQRRHEPSAVEEHRCRK